MATEQVWHGNKKCAVNGAKLPKANRVLGQPCPFCGNTIGAYIGEPEAAQPAEASSAQPETIVAAASWWSRRKTWHKVALIALGGLIALSVIGSLLGDPEESASDAATPTAEAPSTEDAVVTTLELVTPETTEVTTTAVETTTTTEALPGVGEAVRDGKFEFVVTGIEEPGKVYDPDNLLDDEANGVWFIVLMTVENIGDQQQSFFAGEQKLDWDGKEFTAADFTWNGTSFEELNPGVTVEATVMFDVPEDFPEGGAETVLELHDSLFSFGVDVYL